MRKIKLPVIAAVLLLATIAVAGFFVLNERTDVDSRHVETSSLILFVGHALNLQAQDSGAIPKPDQIDAIVKRPLVDAWGRRLIYRVNVGNAVRPFELYSLGPDGVDEHGAGKNIDFWYVAKMMGRTE